MNHRSLIARGLAASALIALTAAACGGMTDANDVHSDVPDAGPDVRVTKTPDATPSQDAPYVTPSPDAPYPDVHNDPPPLYVDNPDANQDCNFVETTSLPGVHIVFRTTSCTFTLAQARAGVSITYDLVVDSDVDGFTPAHAYYYGSDAANLALTAVLQGGQGSQQQLYCLCDKGLPYPQCPADDGGLYPARNDAGVLVEDGCGPVTIPQGWYRFTFGWDGRNWYGPSDTANAEGAPFPPGDYELTVTTVPGSIGDAGSLQASAKMTVHLLP
jgi:hypothetical protein